MVEAHGMARATSGLGGAGCAVRKPWVAGEVGEALAPLGGGPLERGELALGTNVELLDLAAGLGQVAAGLEHLLLHLGPERK